jgi:tRNA-dihydrouridine synthase B
MNIKHVFIENKLVLAPLAGVTDLPFRQICKDFGAGLVFTEMVSADGIVRGNKPTLSYLEFDPHEHPIGVQLFGSRPELLAQATEIVSRLGFDFIDMNLGCPVPKVTKRGAGSALLKDLPQIEKIVRAMVASTDIPILAKIRKGWGPEDNVAVEVAQLLEACGVAGITVHPRTQSMKFTGKADWDVIRAVKAAVSLPVIGNGDIFSGADAARMLAETGCDLIMVGRGVFGNPWLIREIVTYLNDGTILPPPSDEEVVELCLKHFHLALERRSERYIMAELRKHIGWYSKGLPQSSAFRNQLFQLKSWRLIERYLLEFRDFVVRNEKQNRARLQALALQAEPKTIAVEK